MAFEHFPDQPELIYVHIPKTAGTAFRQLLWNLYGREAVFWRGVDSPLRQKLIPERLTGYRMVGGHFSLYRFASYFPDSLRAAVVREPLERAISLHHYYTERCPEEQRKNWLWQGMDPASVRRSLQNCRRFRTHVSNHQCRLLSGRRDHKAALDDISRGNIILGTLRHLDVFIEAISGLLRWEQTQMPIINTGTPGYAEAALRDRTLLKELTELNREDLALYKAVNKHKRWIHLEQQAGLNRILSMTKARPVTRRSRVNTEYTPEALSQVRIEVQSRTLVRVRPGQRAVFPCQVTNDSDVTFCVAGYQPVTLGAHWFDAHGVKEIHEGGRQSLPGPLKPNTTLEVDFVTTVPKELGMGMHEFQISLLHQGVRWLETVDRSHVGIAQIVIE